MTVEMIVILIEFLAIGGLLFFCGRLYQEKEHYRCRVAELTKGKEGSYLVVAEPDRPAPTQPEKPENEKHPQP